MAAGVVGAIPLTGVVTPFLSYGGSAMAANFAALGILSSIHADKRPAADFRSFDVSLRWPSAAAGVAALALVAIAIDIQVVHADDYAVRPQLGSKAGGGYAYSPHSDGRGSRGSIDGGPPRRPTAPWRARPEAASRSTPPAVRQTCCITRRRCFHLLGDATSRCE